MNIPRLVLALLLSFVTLMVSAGEIKPYDQASFDALTKAGKPVVVAVHATWCPTCKAQLPIQKSLIESPEFKDYTMLTLDFDRDTDILKAFRVVRQSTIIVFKGSQEVGRSIGDTDKDRIKALFEKASAAAS